MAVALQAVAVALQAVAAVLAAVVVTTVVGASSNHAAICQPLSKPFVARVNAQHGGMAVAMVVDMVVHPARRLVPAVNPTPCAPVLT